MGQILIDSVHHIVTLKHAHKFVWDYGVIYQHSREVCCIVCEGQRNKFLFAFFMILMFGAFSTLFPKVNEK